MNVTQIQIVSRLLSLCVVLCGRGDIVTGV